MSTPHSNHAQPSSEDPAPEVDAEAVTPVFDPRVASRLADAVELAEAAAKASAGASSEAGEQAVGEHVDVQPEDPHCATHYFAALLRGYHGWRWAVSVACPAPEDEVTVSEVVLLPGPASLVAPRWVPWQERVRSGDLSVGDVMPTEEDDPRLVPGYLHSDDPAVETVSRDLGLGRPRVLSRYGRIQAAERWQDGEFGPHSRMARSAPDSCGRCGFYQPLAGSLSASFGACCNELSPAEGHVVHTEYGCGAHSEARPQRANTAEADLVFDDGLLDSSARPVSS